MILILLIILTIVIYKIVSIKKAHKDLYAKLCNIAGYENVKTISKNKAFDYEMQYNNKIYLIKLIYHPSCAEINVNSKDYWQINRGVVSSRKDGEQMKGVYDLINYNLRENNYPKNTVKLYVIYPDSTGLLKVINECEMKFISPSTDIYGTKINRFKDLEENIDLL